MPTTMSRNQTTSRLMLCCGDVSKNKWIRLNTLRVDCLKLKISSKTSSSPKQRRNPNQIIKISSLIYAMGNSISSVETDYLEQIKKIGEDEKTRTDVLLIKSVKDLVARVEKLEKEKQNE